MRKAYLGDERDRDTLEIMEMCNQLGRFFAQARNEGPNPEADALIITGLIVFAGCVQGELIGMNMVDDAIPDDDLTKMLVHNFKTGSQVGQDKVARIRRDIEDGIPERVPDNEVCGGIEIITSGRLSELLAAIRDDVTMVVTEAEKAATGQRGKPN